MFLTKECDYAIRIVRSLANQEMKTVRTICENEHIPHPFAYKILKKLEHASIVQSFRGAAGGYQLTRQADALTLLDIVAAVDEDLFINECLQAGFLCENNREGSPCGVHSELNRIQEILFAAMSEKKMNSLL